MREIKFRAIHKEDLGFVEKGETKLFYQEVIEDEYDIPELWFVMEGDPDFRYRFEAVFLDDDWYKMQFTGLKDKNGKEIYEGDIILNHNYDTKGEVKWVDGNAEYICYHASGWFKFTDEYEVEVIGNIYENPELLEEGKCNK